MKSFAHSTLFIVLAVATGGGCQKSDEPLVPVTGRVLVDGKPSCWARPSPFIPPMPRTERTRLPRSMRTANSS